MVAVISTIDRIIETPSTKPTKEEAEKILRSCGILDRNNNIKPAYRQMLSNESRNKNERK